VTVPLHLAGNNAPIAEERDVTDVRVRGALPRDLHGVFVRNGPNPRTGRSPHLFAGDGMVHGVALEDGHVRWYRNRYVRTPLYEHPGVDRMDLAFDRRTGAVDHRVTTANTHVVEHGGRILALEEGGFPYELDADLGTVGPWTFDGRLTTPMTAHPKRCPRTGDLLFFGYQLRPPFVTYHRADAAGRLVRSVPLTLPRATMLHDFAITDTRVVFHDSPLVFDPSAIAPTGSPWRWDAEHGARFGVLPRDGDDADIRWVDVDAFHLSHVSNAHDDGDHVVLTGTRIGAPDGLPAMHRWTIDVAAGRVSEEALDDEPAEYPRVPDALVGRRTRYEYVTSFVFAAEPDHHEIHKHDLVAGTRTACVLPSGHTCGEPVFVPRAGAIAEDDGYLLTFGHDRAGGTSALLVLDAADVAGPPVAVVDLGVRVPAGFHGSWIDRSSAR
jgi:carotenoid cleavage dioxygenase